MTETTQSKGKRIARWILQGLLTAVFLPSGSIKLAGTQKMADNFAHWGFPSWFLYVTGAIEVACAVALWVPRLGALAALGLSATMVGAAHTHLTHGDAAHSGPAIVLFILSTTLLYIRRDELLSLIGLGRKGT